MPVVPGLPRGLTPDNFNFVYDSSNIYSDSSSPPLLFDRSRKVEIMTEDGVPIKGYWLPFNSMEENVNSSPENFPILLYFPGNGGDYGTRLGLARYLMQGLNVNIFIPSYHGYGDSGGYPSQNGLTMDARAAFQFIRTHFPSTQIIIYGHSIGCAVSLSLLSSLEDLSGISAIILENPFRSISSVVLSMLHIKSELLRRTLKSFLIQDDWDNESAVTRLVSMEDRTGQQLPILILSGYRDLLLPFDSHSKALFQILVRNQIQNFPIQFINHISRFASNENSKYWTIFEEGDHNDTLSQPGCLDAILEFLNGINPSV